MKSNLYFTANKSVCNNKPKEHHISECYTHKATPSSTNITNRSYRLSDRHIFQYRQCPSAVRKICEKIKPKDDERHKGVSMALIEIEVREGLRGGLRQPPIRVYRTGWHLRPLLERNVLLPAPKDQQRCQKYYKVLKNQGVSWDDVRTEFKGHYAPSRRKEEM